MNKILQKKDKPRVNVGFGIGLGEYTAATLIGFISGATGAVKTIRDRFYDDFKHSSVMTKLASDHSSELDSTTEEFHLTYPKCTEGESEATYLKTKRAKLLEELKPLRDKFFTNRDGLLHDSWMIRKGFVESTLDMTRRMQEKSGSVKKIIINSIIGAAIGAGAMLSFFNGIATRAKINAIDDAVESDLENQPTDQKPLAYKDRDPLPSKEWAKNSDKPAHVNKVEVEISGKSLRDKYPELREEHAESKSHADHGSASKSEGLKEERPKSSHVDKLMDADQQPAFAAAR